MNVAIITGASGGIGEAIAERLAQSGWPLLLIARSELRLHELATRLRQAGAEVETLALDLVRPEAASILVDHLSVRDWQPGLLINNAGSQRFGSLGDQSDADIEGQLALNLLAPIRLIRALLPLMGVDGQVVNIGSSFSAIGYPGFSVYCASKAGLRGFSQALDRERGPAGPRIRFLAPRATRTGFNSVVLERLNQRLGNRVDSPERVAGELMRLLGQKGTERFIGWPEKWFVRLNALWPALIGRAIAGQRELIMQHAQEETRERERCNSNQ